MLIRFKRSLISLFVCSFMFASLNINVSYANKVNNVSAQSILENQNFLYEWNYGIVEDEPFKESTKFFIDEEKTTLTIDHKKKEISLFREDIRNPIRFIDEENSPIAYSVMTENGIKQFAYDGTGMAEVGFLEIEVENPIAMATKQSSPDLVVVHNPALNEDIENGLWNSPTPKEREERDDYKLEYYGFDGFEMISVPFLEMAGLNEVRAMGYLEDEMAALLTHDSLNFYGSDGVSMIELPQIKLADLENPLDFASDREYNISLLTEDEIKQFSFGGSGLTEIPGLSIAIGDMEDVIDPRSIASVEGRITFIDESKAYTYLRGSDEMHYVEALSVTEGLTSPMGLSIHRNSNDLIILDELEDKSVIRYYMFDGISLLEIPTLSLELENIILNTGGKYDLKGVLVSKPLVVEKNYIDLVQVGIYSHLEEDTSIKLFVSNGYETSINADDEDIWKPIWNLDRKEGESEPTLYKNHGKDFEEDWHEYEGGNSELYPINLETGLVIDTNPKLDDYEVIEDEDGNLYLRPKEENEKRKWFKFEIPLEDINIDKDSFVKFKMEFYSKEGKKTPKVFVPSERNPISGVKDDVAIRILARRKPLIPVIDDIDPEIPETDEFPEFPQPIAIPGWVYTTTPNIKWRFPIIDTQDNNDDIDDTYQMAYQLVLMAITDDGYEPAFVTDMITTSSDGPIQIVRELRIPTSNSADIEGPLYTSGSYQFATFVRAWDPEGNPSEFSVGKRFNVLAYERPRIERIESTPSGLMDQPTMINKDMTVEELLKAKSGTAITFLVDVVGPIENDLESDEDISIFYYTDIKNTDFLMEKGVKKSLYSIGSPVNRISITTWTPAPVTENVEGSIVKTYLRGDSSIGGRTIFCIPYYAEGIAEINSTVYKDWEVFLDGRD